MTALAIHDHNGVATTTDPRLPAPVDKAALRSYLAILEDPEALELQNRLAKAYDAACRSLIGPNDVQKEGKGDFAREFKKKSAWKKLARYFSISTTVIERDERFVNDPSTGESVFVATCTVRATSPWGQTADALAACASDEETGRRKITIADAIATAETRASNRATSNLIAMGEVSAEETTREDREKVAEDALREMTIDEAKAVKFPWKNPEKYRDKPLGELSLKMLTSVLDATQKEIEKVGLTPRRMELQRACELLIADKQAAAASEPSTGEQNQQGATDVSGAGEPGGDTSREGRPSAGLPSEFPLPFKQGNAEKGTPLAKVETKDLNDAVRFAGDVEKYAAFVDAAVEELERRTAGATDAE